MSANQKNIHFLLHSHTTDMRNLVNLSQNITSMMHNNFTAWNHVTQNSSCDRNHVEDDDKDDDHHQYFLLLLLLLLSDIPILQK